MSGDFIDSNVFVYLFDPSDRAKQLAAEELIAAAITRGEASISFQVVQETLSVLTRKFQTTVTANDTRRLLQNVLAPLWRVMPSQGLYEHALGIQERYAYSF